MEQEGAWMKQTERELKLLIIEKAEKMANILSKGNDCEIRTSPKGISVLRIKKEVIE